jgi:putative membrane protein
MMKWFQVFKDDLNNSIKKPMFLITFLAVACVPILYSGFLLKGTWDPYGKLENLPVAVVNLDKGTLNDRNKINIGETFIEELEKNPKFAWKFVDQQTAAQGMANNRYYAMITIPSDFSQNAASLTSDNPHQAEIQYESNSYYNFIAGQISENAIKELRTQLSESLTESYTKSVFQQFTKLSNGLQAAGDGAENIHSGAEQLEDGLKKVSANLAKLSTGAVQIQESTKKLSAGSSQLKTGAEDLSIGASDLAEGSEQLNSAGKQLETGAKSAQSGTKSLGKGIQSAKKGAEQLTAGLQSSLKGSQQLEAGLSASSSSSKNLSNGASQVTSGLQQIQFSHPELASDPDFQKILAASKEVSSGAKQLSEGQAKLLTGSQSLTDAQKQLLSGSQKLSQAHEQLLQGANKLQKGQDQLADGLQAYNSKFTNVVTGSQQLAGGANQIQSGAGKLHDGLVQLAAGSGTLVTGSQQLTSGTKKLETGASRLRDGSGQLAEKLTDSAKQASDIKADDKKMKLFSNPVSIKANDDRHIQLYGYGIAPYFISLALFAGCLVFTTVYAARTSTTRKDAAGLPLFVSKLLAFSLMSLGQAFITCTVLLYFLGLKVQSVPLFYGFTALVAFTFMLFCQAMVTLLDQVGRFIILLVMIFQLASSAGTFPFELLPNWAKMLNPWLPMTYSIRGFRDVISSSDFGDLQVQVYYLLIFLVIFLAMIVGYFFFTRPRRRKRSFAHV